jgi:hypothetical protein
MRARLTSHLPRTPGRDALILPADQIDAAPGKAAHVVVAPGPLLLRRTRRLGVIGALASSMLLIPSVRQAAKPSALVPALLPLLIASISVLGAYASHRAIAAHIRDEARRDAALADLARRDGVTLAVNTVRHSIGNKLAVTVGYSEMLADDPRLPPEVQEQADKVLSSAIAAADVIHLFNQQLVSVKLDPSVAGPTVLDINASWGGRH